MTTRNARLDMSRELVDFLEREVPPLFTAVIQLVASVVILSSFGWQLGVMPVIACLLMTDTAIFKCANASLWDALGDGRKDKRQHALDVTSHAIKLTQYSSDDESRSKLYRHRGMLEMAMAIENNMPYFVISSDFTMKKDFENSLKLKPEYIPTLFFKDTLDITRESLFNHWKNVLNIGNATISRMKYLDDMGDIPDLSLNIYGTLAVYSGLPLSTTLPNKILAFYDRIGCNKAVPGCAYNPKVAPFAVPGVNFTVAEAYARIGQKQKAIKYLHKSQTSPNFDNWRYNFLVKDALKDPDGFLNQFVKSGPYKQVMFDMYVNKNRSCLMCHGRS